jgi:hypothetical protein
MRTANIYRHILGALLILGFNTACNDKDTPATDISGTVKLSFSNVVNTAPMVLNTQTYTNPAGENYTLSKFKYYVTYIEVGNASTKAAEKDSYHLVDQSIASSQSFNISMGVNNYTTFSFLLGVDSTRNVSGAQTGALDPLNDMFWTWNSGYIMAKMEGNSPVSTQPNNKVEYHIGGFSGPNSVLKKITLTMPAGKTLDVREGKTSEIKITADFARWWQNPNNITIAALPVCTTPGVQAKQIADNYANMFTLTDVINN